MISLEKVKELQIKEHEVEALSRSKGDKMIIYLYCVEHKSLDEIVQMFVQVPGMKKRMEEIITSGIEEIKNMRSGPKKDTDGEKKAA